MIPNLTTFFSLAMTDLTMGIFAILPSSVSFLLKSDKFFLGPILCDISGSRFIALEKILSSQFKHLQEARFYVLSLINETYDIAIVVVLINLIWR